MLPPPPHPVFLVPGKLQCPPVWPPARHKRPYVLQSSKVFMDQLSEIPPPPLFSPLLFPPPSILPPIFLFAPLSRLWTTDRTSDRRVADGLRKSAIGQTARRVGEGEFFQTARRGRSQIRQVFLAIMTDWSLYEPYTQLFGWADLIERLTWQRPAV